MLLLSQSAGGLSMIHAVVLTALLGGGHVPPPALVKVDYPLSYPRFFGISLPRVRVVLLSRVTYPVRRFLVAGDKVRNGEAMVSLIEMTIPLRGSSDMGAPRRIKYDAVEGTVVILAEPDVHKQVGESINELGRDFLKLSVQGSKRKRTVHRAVATQRAGQQGGCAAAMTVA